MTATRYPDMVTLASLTLREPVHSDIDTHPRGRYFPDEPTCARDCDDWADWELGAVLRMTREGLAPLEIAEELGVGVQAVRILHEAIPAWLAGKTTHHRVSSASVNRAPARVRGLTPEQKAQAEEMHARGAGYREIALAVGVSLGRVRYVLAGS